MDFLHARRAFVRHTDVYISIAQNLADFPAATPSKRHHHHIALVRRFDGCQHIG